MAQRKARGPLPDWDDVAEAGMEDGFDYMDLMETQYSQFYAMSAVPPFDPSLGLIDPSFSTASYLQQFQQRMALAYRHSFVLAQPTAAGVTAQMPNVAAAGVPNAVTVSGPVTQSLPTTAGVMVTTVGAAAIDANSGGAITASSRPGSAASSLTSATVPPTPTALLSPNSIVVPSPHMTTIAVTAFPTSADGIAVQPQHISPLPASASTAAVLTQFPATIFPAQAGGFGIDEGKLKDIVRKQM